MTEFEDYADQLKNLSTGIIKCAFCDFATERCIHSVHMPSGGGMMQVFSSGWYELQEHCYNEHRHEPAVKELLFADRVIFDGGLVDEHFLNNTLMVSKRELYIEPAWEELL